MSHDLLVQMAYNTSLPAADQYFKPFFLSQNNRRCCALLHFLQDGNQVKCTCSQV